MSQLFQVYEQDLVQMEQSLPILAQAVGPLNDPRLKRHLRLLKEIVSNVRWNYGPHDQVEKVEDHDG